MRTRLLERTLLLATLIAACEDEPDARDRDASPSPSGPEVASPDPGEPVEPAILEEGELAPGGATTTPNVGVGAFTVAAANLSIARRGPFDAGLQFFQLPWVVAPGRADTDGLGPTFHADSCLGCHGRNGRGTVDTILLRIGLGPENVPVPNYGGQLQPFAIPGVVAEGVPVRRETVTPHERADGSTASLLLPTYEIQSPGFGPLGPDLRISPRIAPPIVGQGLLEAISDADLVAAEDPNDRDGDGISGRVHWVDDGVAHRVGRFGWKAGQPSVEAQTSAAFSEDLGITSSRLPGWNCPGEQTACAAAKHGGTPELGASRLAVTVAYVRLLGVPVRRNGESPDALRGKAVFRNIRCAACHTPSFRTSASALEPELADQRIWPYSDLLLHDLGERLSDRRRDGDAGEREWRTPPLWGIGLVPLVDGTGTYHLLHDGRARSIAEAISWHDGEAKASRLAFEKLSATDQESLRIFVESL